MSREPSPRLLEQLMRLSASDALPMHMPGHKRNPGALDLPPPVPIDITEIDGFDNLHDAGGLLLACQRRAADVFGAEETHFLVNGTSCGVLAAITALTPPGGTLLLARNAHRSALNAVTLGGIRPAYVYPEFLPRSGISGPIDPEAVARALAAHPEARCAFITSPTYEGVISDVAAIARACHARGVPLIVDEAHGAHLGFGGFPRSAIRCGADVAVQSVHKTLGSLTQTALLHISGPLVDRARLRKRLTMFQTSSPSYVLMASIDECALRMGERGDALADAWLRRLADFRRWAAPLRRLKLLPLEDVACDPSKLNIGCQDAGLSGAALQAALQSEFHIELEMAAGHYAIAMTGVGDADESMRRLADALLAIDGRSPDVAAPPPANPLPERVEVRMTPAEADALPHEDVPVARASGRISAEAVFAYPPGIPLIAPGEVVDAALLTAPRGVALHGESGGLPDAIRCVAEHA